MRRAIEPTWQLQPVTPGSPVVHDRGALIDADLNTVWHCDHTHDTRAEAQACAEQHLQEGGSDG